MRPSDRLIPKAFFLREVEAVAQDLVGRFLRHGDVVLRITETEAYGGPGDTASHCHSGRTPRNAPMWEEGGRAYVYLCYGMHHLLNLVTGPKDEPGAVLIRACEPISGLELMQQRRGKARGPALLTGPGKVSQALALDLSFNHHLLYEPGGLELCEGVLPESLLRGPRVGIDYAAPADREAPLRFALAGSPWVSNRKGLA